MTNDPFPFGLGKRRLLFSERAESAKPILLGTRTLDPGDSIHLFAESDVVKTQLEAAIAQSRPLDCRIHPTPIELRAAIYSITFFEYVAAQHNGRWGTPKVIEHDNWQKIFWIFLRLFECGRGFIARWEDRYTYMNDLWENERKYRIDELAVRSLADDCGKCYSTRDGRTLLEYVDEI